MEEKEIEIIEPEIAEEVQEEIKPERPQENYRAELDRKTREIEELRGKIDSAVKGYNPNDITTWDDRQLFALKSAPDVKPEFKAQADDILMERKIDRRMAAERERSDRQSFETKRIDEFPETADPSSPLSVRMNRIARDLRLDNSPSGFYAAAKIAASEIKKPSKPGASQEKDRIRGIKAAQTSPDRPRSGAPVFGATYEEVMKKAGHNNDAFIAALRAKAGGPGLNVPSSGLHK